MDLVVGTSGFSYPEWRGSFYPEGLPADEMLRSYSEKLPSVEINNTFYRMPQPALLEGWNEKAQGDFTFALKAPRSITHIGRLKDMADPVAYFLKVAGTLGPRLGPVLFQLPPFFKKDVAVLRDFLALLPPGLKAAFEFRHPTWFDDEVSQVLGDARAALVAGDPDEGDALPLIATAPFGYLRLRAPSYDAAGLSRWHAQITSQPWQTAYVYLKHEVLGPAYAQALQALSRGETPIIPEPLADPPPPKKRIAKTAKPKPAKTAKKKT
jgi:uncharacterized protein YecE (DUF72 family)